MTKEYLMKFLTMENIHNSMLVVLQYFLRPEAERHIVLALSSIYLHHILGVFDYLHYHKNMWYKVLYWLIDPCVKKSNRTGLMLGKQYLEMI